MPLAQFNSNISTILMNGGPCQHGIVTGQNLFNVSQKSVRKIKWNLDQFYIRSQLCVIYLYLSISFCFSWGRGGVGGDREREREGGAPVCRL